MNRTVRRGTVLAAFVSLAMVVAACTSHASGSGSGSPVTPPTAATTALPKAGTSPVAALTAEELANVNAGGTPHKGGTLRIVGSSDVDHLDTVAAYDGTTWALMRTFTRQLFANPASTDPATVISVVPDVATEIPTTANGGLSADGKTYTIHLRTGVMWNTTPAREVTAADFVLGFKRLCNPTQNSVGAPGYYEGVIAGMTEYCAGFANVKPTVSAFKSYITAHDISGVKAVNASTIQFTLVKPAGDFLDILALAFSSAAPVEYLNYLPDSAQFRQHTLADGPYYIAQYTPGQHYLLKQNPAWQQNSDPIRHQYVDQIEVMLGLDESAVQQQIEAGTADVEWDTHVPTADVPQLRATNDARMGIYPKYDTSPYVVFNIQSPNNSGALGKVAVRQALEYAFDKAAIGKLFGGASLATPLNQVIPPGSVGYQPFDPYPTPGNAGDPAKCKSMLAAAGYPHGLTLTDVYQTSGENPQVFQVDQASLAACGVTVKGVPVQTSDFYGKYLSSPTDAKSGAWDFAEPTWGPDWYGDNARTVMEPLFDGRHYGPGSTDYSGYNNAAVDSDIDQALASGDTATVQKYMHDADVQVMKDAVIVPLQTLSEPLFHSSRVHNAIEWTVPKLYFYPQIWLSGS